LRAKGATPGRAEARRGEARHRPLLSNHRFVPKLKPTPAEGTFFMSTYMPAWFGRKPVGGWAGAVPSCLWVSLGARMRARLCRKLQDGTAHVRKLTSASLDTDTSARLRACVPARLQTCATAPHVQQHTCATAHLPCMPARRHARAPARQITCVSLRLSLSLCVLLCPAAVSASFAVILSVSLSASSSVSVSVSVPVSVSVSASVSD